MKALLLIAHLVGFSTVLLSQLSKADSLLSVIESTNDDSILQDARLQYIAAVNNNFEHSEPIIKAGIDLAKENNDFKSLANFYSAGAVMYAYVGENDLSYQWFEISLNYRVYLKDTMGIAASYLGLSNISRNMGDFRKAIDFALKAEKTFKEGQDYSGLARVYNALGLLFKQEMDFEKALFYYNEGLKNAEKSNDIIVKMGLLDNIGGVYQHMKEWDTAAYYHQEALDLKLVNPEPMGLGRSYGNLGLVFMNFEQYDSALHYLHLTVNMFETIDYAEGLCIAYATLGEIWMKKGNRNKAISNYKLAESYGEKGHFLTQLLGIFKMLGQLYEESGNYKQSTYYFRQSIILKDSLYNTEKTAEVQKREIAFQFEQKQLADSLKREEENKIKELEVEQTRLLNEEQLARQKVYTYSGVGAFLLVLSIAFILFNNNSKQKKLNQIIAEQKSTVEEKNKEITDSINYAKRIQSAILPADRAIKKLLPESFVVYLPKDIVAGDFYWLEENKGRILLAAADCTGHGVPGAMVSVICNNALNRTVREYQITEPGKMLDKTREIVIQEFEKSEEEVKDGMDIALCCLSPGGILQFAGAHNPLWLIRKNSTVVEEIKSDKQPIGKFDHLQSFHTHEIELNKGDSFYLFTDGFADQFGGDHSLQRGKKYKNKKFKAFLSTICHLPMEEQKEKLIYEFNRWKGNYEQLDDVCVIGVSV